MTAQVSGSQVLDPVSGKNLMPGTQFGRFRIVRVLGSGGMATVYLADMLGAGGFSRPVALKLIHPHLAHTKSFRTWFVNEARLGGTLLHPNLVSTLDFGEVEGRMFMALEYVDGCTLSDLDRQLRRMGQPMPLSIVLAVLIQTCRALEYAHRARHRDGRPLKLIHRDIKPSNIMLDRFGVVKLGDFGVARAAMNLEQTEVTGIVKGSLRYMSPEQAMGLRSIDERSDLFSLAIVAYELFTRLRLYDAPNDLQVLRLAQDAVVDERLLFLEDLLDGNELLPILKSALARRPEDRFASAHELRCAFEKVLSRCGQIPRLDDVWLQPYLDALNSLQESALRVPLQRVLSDPEKGPEAEVEHTEIELDQPVFERTECDRAPDVVMECPALVERATSAGLVEGSGAAMAVPQLACPIDSGTSMSTVASADSMEWLSIPELEQYPVHVSLPAEPMLYPSSYSDCSQVFWMETELSLEPNEAPPMPSSALKESHVESTDAGAQADVAESIPIPATPFERVALLRTLAREAPDQALAMLQDMAANDPDRSVREFCRRELTRFEPRRSSPTLMVGSLGWILPGLQLTYLLYAILFLGMGVYLLVVQPGAETQASLYLLRYGRERPFLNLMISGLCFWAALEAPNRTIEATIVKWLALVPILLSFPLGPVIGPAMLCGLYLQQRAERGRDIRRDV